MKGVARRTAAARVLDELLVQTDALSHVATLSCCFQLFLQTFHVPAPAPATAPTSAGPTYATRSCRGTTVKKAVRSLMNSSGAFTQPTLASTSFAVAALARVPAAAAAAAAETAAICWAVVVSEGAPHAIAAAFFLLALSVCHPATTRPYNQPSDS